MAQQSTVLVDRHSGLPWREGWSLSGSSQGKKYAVQSKTYRGGLSEGVWSLEVDNGAWRIEILPTRGMSLAGIECGEVRLGWRSPVVGPVHPQYVPLAEPSGLGWLDGFDEFLVRCGLESNGAPDFDPQGRLLYPLHGRIGNRPAQRVTVEVDDQRGELRVTGEVAETRFHLLKVLLSTTLITHVGTAQLEIIDRVTNLSALPAEIQMLYHINLGQPLLDAGSTVLLPARQVVPRNDASAKARATWDHFAGEQAGFAEQVYFCNVWSDAEGHSEALLKNAHGTCGFGLRYRVAELPCFTLWKNTAASEDGYVTGLEPGTNYPNPRSFERQHQRHLRLEGGASREFHLQCAYYADSAQLAEPQRRIQAMRQGETRLDDQPLPDWCA
jgi:hypothetical protein